MATILPSLTTIVASSMGCELIGTIRPPTIATGPAGVLPAVPVAPVTVVLPDMCVPPYF